MTTREWRFALLLSLLVASAIVAWWQYDRTKTYEVLFGAGKIDGDSFEVANALKTVLSEQAPSLHVEILETEGTGQSLDLLQRGLLHFAAIQADSQIPDSVRLVARLYPDAYQVVVREESEIHSMLDFKGRRLAVSTSAEAASLLVATQHFGLLEEDFEVIEMSDSSARWALLDGAIDAIFSVEPPGSTLRLRPGRALDRGGCRPQAAEASLNGRALGEPTLRSLPPSEAGSSRRGRH